MAVTLATVLTAQGVSNEREAEIAFLALIPSYLSFLLAPVVDCGMPRRVWAMLLACLGAVCLGTAVLLLPKASVHGGYGADATLLVTTLFLGYLCTQLYSSTIGGMVPNLVRPSQQAAAGAWLNVAYLGMTGFCGSLSVWEMSRFSVQTAALLVPLPILLSASPLLFTAKEARPPRPVSEAMGQLGRNLLRIARQKTYLWAMLVCIVPAATFAMQNLFGGIGRDFGASDSLTGWVSGVGLAIASIVGSALGGPLSNRYDRRLLFVAPAMVAACGSLLMVVALHARWHTVGVFVAGVCFYNLMAGINFTAFSALLFQIIGLDNPLSATKYAICTAAANAAIAFSVILDGKGSTLHGPLAGSSGELLVDALLSLLLGSILLLVVWRFGGGCPRPRLEQDAATSQDNQEVANPV